MCASGQRTTLVLVLAFQLVWGRVLCLSPCASCPPPQLPRILQFLLPNLLGLVLPFLTLHAFCIVKLKASWLPDRCLICWAISSAISKHFEDFSVNPFVSPYPFHYFLVFFSALAPFFSDCVWMFVIYMCSLPACRAEDSPKCLSSGARWPVNPRSQLQLPGADFTCMPKRLTFYKVSGD